MANILYPPARPQSVGEVLDTVFRIFGRTVVKCVPYAVLAMIARQLPNIYSLFRGRAPMLLTVQDPVFWLLYVVGALAGVVLLSALLLRQYAMATGHPIDLRAELATATRRLGAVLLMGLLLMILILISLVPMLLALAFPGWLRVLVVIVMALVPSCVFLAFSSAWPIVLLTDRGAAASLEHSARLTWGNWWRLTLIYTVALVLLLVLYSLSGLVAVMLAGLLARADLIMITAITTVVMIVISAIGTPLYSALSLAVLGDLSVRKEGADLERRIAAPATP